MKSPGHARTKLTLVAPHRGAERAPMDDTSDALLVERIRGGDAKSREQIYRRHVDYIAGMATRILRSTDAGEDVVQDTFVIAFDRMDDLRDPAALRGWLASIAISQVHRRLARQRLLRILGLDRPLEDAPLDELAIFDTTAEVRSELAALDLVLRRLPADQRIAWMLRHVEGESLDAVAVACRCSLATVKRRIAAADERVRAHVKFARDEEAT